MKRFIIILLLITIHNSMSAQSTNDSLALDLEADVIQLMDQNSIPGLSASIIKEGQIVWKMSEGYAHLEDSIEVIDETIFTLASISKLFVATACAQLHENGLLDLDADINNYLPTPIVNPNFPSTAITTRNLLLHKSSLHDSESDLQLWDAPGNPIYELDEFCQEYFIPGGSLYVASNWGTTSPDNSPYWYTNAGFTLLGWIIEEVSGQAFNEYVRDQILIPLEMTSSGWNYSEVDSNLMAMPYDNTQNPYGFYSVPEYPAAMLKSNILELSNFLIAYTQRGVFGDITLFSQKTHDLIVPSELMEGLAWWGQDTWWGDPDGEFWSHGGYMNGVRTQLNYYPDDSTGLIILTNGEGDYFQIQNLIESYIPLFEVADETTIIQNVETEEDFTLNSNLVQDQLDIQIKKLSSTHSEFTIVDLYGKIVYSKKPQMGHIQISVSSLAKGMYFIRFNDSSKQFLVQ